jgi:hypothetical protein
MVRMVQWFAKSNFGAHHENTSVQSLDQRQVSSMGATHQQVSTHDTQRYNKSNNSRCNHQIVFTSKALITVRRSTDVQLVHMEWNEDTYRNEQCE